MWHIIDTFSIPSSMSNRKELFFLKSTAFQQLASANNVQKSYYGPCKTNGGESRRQIQRFYYEKTLVGKSYTGYFINKFKRNFYLRYCTPSPVVRTTCTHFTGILGFPRFSDFWYISTIDTEKKLFYGKNGRRVKKFSSFSNWTNAQYFWPEPLIRQRFIKTPFAFARFRLIFESVCPPWRGPLLSTCCWFCSSWWPSPKASAAGGGAEGDNPDLKN